MLEDPQDRVAEMAVLGCVQFEPALLDELDLTPEDFYLQKHAWMFRAMLDLRNQGQPVDFLTITDLLDKRHQLDSIGGAAYVLQVLNAVPSSLEAPAYAAIVREKAARRNLISIAAQVTKEAYYDEDVEAVQARAEAALLKTRRVSEDGKTGADILNDIDLEIAEPKDNVTDRVFLGLAPIDAGLFGIASGTYWLIAGVPGTGKSVLAINAMRLLPAGSGCLYFCPEQSPQEIMSLAYASGTDDVTTLRTKLLRLSPGARAGHAKALLGADARLAQQIYGTGITFEQLTQDITPSEKRQLSASRAQLNSKSIWPIVPGDKDIYSLRRVMRQKRAELNRTNPDAFMLVVMDGLGLFRQLDPKNKVASLMEISREIKVAAMNDITPGAILVNHHMNKDDRRQRSYTMERFRDAPVINDADVGLFVDRDSVWDEQRRIPPAWEPLNFIVVKNRQTGHTHVSSTMMNTMTLQLRDGDRRELNG